MFKIKFLGVVSIIVIYFSGYSQENLLTIQQAVETAINNNAELNQMRAQLAQKENIWRTETGISPAEISYFKEGISSSPDNPFAEKRITISQEIDFPLTTIYRLKAFNQKVEAQKNLIIAKEKIIKSEVKSKYVEVLYAIHLQRSMTNQLKLSQDLYNAVYTKFETGMGNGIDLTNAELQLDEAKNDLDQTEWVLHKARYGLFNIMGLPVNQQKYSIQFTDTLTTIEIDISQIQTLAVQEKQPDFKASVNMLQASNYSVKEAKSNILPDITMSLYKQDYGGGYNYNGFEIGLKIPIWLPFEQKGKIAIAKAQTDEIQWQQEGIRLNMKKQIEYAWHNYSVSRSIVNRYNTSLKEKASKLQSLTLRAYQLGETDLLVLLNAQQMFIKSEQRYLTALRDYYLQLAALEQFLEQDLIF